MNWNKWIRQTHRWLAIAFTAAVIVTTVALAQEKTCRLDELPAAAPARFALVHRYVLVRAAVCHQVARQATQRNMSLSVGVNTMAHLGDENLDAVDRFVTEAELFAHWATAGTDEGAFAARNGLLRLTRLYSAGLELPASSGGDETDESVSARVDDAEWKLVFAYSARLPLDFYGEIFNPLPVPPEEAVVGSLADDIADVYRDVVTGLRHFQAGRRAEALWEWTFSLQSHWGEHATGAIRALHCWLATNDPSRLAPL